MKLIQLLMQQIITLYYRSSIGKDFSGKFMYIKCTYLCIMIIL